MKYAILCRNHGWIDSLLAAGFEPSPGVDYPTRVLRGSAHEKVAVFADKAEADALAGRCNEHWAAMYPDRPWARWTFAVVEEVFVPRWRIVEPKSERERTRLVGSCEQI